MIRTRQDAHVAMIAHIEMAIEEAPTAERALAHATIALALSQMLDRLPQGVPSSIADAIEPR